MTFREWQLRREKVLENEWVEAYSTASYSTWYKVKNAYANYMRVFDWNPPTWESSDYLELKGIIGNEY